MCESCLVRATVQKVIKFLCGMCAFFSSLVLIVCEEREKEGGGGCRGDTPFFKKGLPPFSSKGCTCRLWPPFSVNSYGCVLEWQSNYARCFMYLLPISAFKRGGVRERGRCAVTSQEGG